jgi:hypothetical protein
MQHTVLTLSSATLCYGEKNPNTTAMQRSKRHETQDSKFKQRERKRHLPIRKSVCKVTNETGRTK